MIFTSDGHPLGCNLRKTGKGGAEKLGNDSGKAGMDALAAAQAVCRVEGGGAGRPPLRVLQDPDKNPAPERFPDGSVPAGNGAQPLLRLCLFWKKAGIHPQLVQLLIPSKKNPRDGSSRFVSRECWEEFLGDWRSASHSCTFPPREAVGCPEKWVKSQESERNWRYRSRPSGWF